MYVHICVVTFGLLLVCFFFFNDTATTEIYTLSLHDALPISSPSTTISPSATRSGWGRSTTRSPCRSDRKSTRLNSSHGYISYAVFCLKKKKKTLSPPAVSSSPVTPLDPSPSPPTPSPRRGDS